MSDVDTVLRVLRSELDLAGALDDYVLFGSVILYLHGLRDDIGDIDMFVTYEGWNALKDRRRWEEVTVDEVDPTILRATIYGCTVHCWQRWDDRHGFGDLAAQALDQQRVHAGWRVQPLLQLYKWKQWYVKHCGDHPREKDVLDILAIERYMMDAGL